jgi:anti-anti-sigma factor
MKAESILHSQVMEKCLVIKTPEYVNKESGENIVEEFNKHFDQGIKKLVIDMVDSSVVNSIGISYLIEIIEKLNDVDGKMVFCNLDSSIEKTLKIMGLFNFAGTSETVETAVQKLGDN